MYSVGHVFVNIHVFIHAAYSVFNCLLFYHLGIQPIISITSDIGLQRPIDLYYTYTGVIGI